MITLTKNTLFAMIDTETIYLKKRVYELALVVFDSVTCEVFASKKWYIKEVVDSALYCQLRLGKPPIFWPNRLNPFEILKDDCCVTWSTAINEFMALLSKYNVCTLISHNINFDIGAIYATNNLYKPEDFSFLENDPFLAEYQKLELSGFFIHGLPLMTAYNVPFKAKSGCMTFKADFLVPCFTSNTQNHDALSDCYNQIALYKLTKGKYQNQGTIYANMLAHHKLKHNDNRRLGNASLE